MPSKFSGRQSLPALSNVLTTKQPALIGFFLSLPALGLIVFRVFKLPFTAVATMSTSGRTLAGGAVEVETDDRWRGGARGGERLDGRDGLGALVVAALEFETIMFGMRGFVMPSLCSCAWCPLFRREAVGWVGWESIGAILNCILGKRWVGWPDGLPNNMSRGLPCEAGGELLAGKTVRFQLLVLCTCFAKVFDLPLDEVWGVEAEWGRVKMELPVCAADVDATLGLSLGMLGVDWFLDAVLRRNCRRRLLVRIGASAVFAKIVSSFATETEWVTYDVLAIDSSECMLQRKCEAVRKTYLCMIKTSVLLRSPQSHSFNAYYETHLRHLARAGHQCTIRESSMSRHHCKRQIMWACGSYEYPRPR